MQLQARSEQTEEKGNTEDPVPLQKREDTRKDAEKEMPKGQDPKVPVCPETQTSRYATTFRRSNESA